jgi:hypothetical protein
MTVVSDNGILLVLRFHFQHNTICYFFFFFLNQVSYSQGWLQIHCEVENGLNYSTSSCPHFRSTEIPGVSSFSRLPGLSACYTSPRSVELHSTVICICSSTSRWHWKWFFWNYVQELKKKKTKTKVPESACLKAKKSFSGDCPNQWLQPPFPGAGYWHSTLPFFLIKGLKHLKRPQGFLAFIRGGDPHGRPRES